MALARRCAAASRPKERGASSWPIGTSKRPAASPPTSADWHWHVDVAVEADIQRLVEESTNQFGPIDLFCSNAGIAIGGGVEAPNSDWQRIWDVNLMAHVYAARAVLPAMLERGDGYLLQTASAAGLLTSVGSAPYAVTKHAAVALAEWLSITYGPRGSRFRAFARRGC